MRACGSPRRIELGGSGCCAIVRARCLPVSSWYGLAGGASALPAAMGGVGGHRLGQQRSIELQLSAGEFLDRIAALIAPPRKHRQRYFGVLAPNSPWRALVTAQASRKLEAERGWAWCRRWQGAVRVVGCQYCAMEIAQFLLVRPVNPVKNWENIGSVSKTMVGLGSE